MKSDEANSGNSDRSAATAASETEYQRTRQQQLATKIGGASRPMPNDPKLVINIDDDDEAAAYDQSKAVDEHLTGIIGSKRGNPGNDDSLSPDKVGSPKKRDIKAQDKQMLQKL